MKRFVMAAALCAFLASTGAAQQTAADSPATKEEIEKYFQVMHVRDMMKNMMDAMTKQMHQMVHDQVAKDAAKLPPDFEERSIKRMDDTLKEMPFEEMLQAMAPVYQRHLSKGDLDAIVAFYSTPTGQKLLREQPAMMQEAMQASFPIMQRMMKSMTDRVQQEIAQAVKDPKSKASGDSKASPN